MNIAKLISNHNKNNLKKKIKIIIFIDCYVFFKNRLLIFIDFKNQKFLLILFKCGFNKEQCSRIFGYYDFSHTT